MSDRVIMSRISLFPALMVVGLLALGLKVYSISSGYDLLTSPAVAQETQEEENKTDEVGEASKEEEKVVAPSRQPLIIGLPPAEEMEILLQLKQRREDLDGRALKLDMQEQLLASTEKRIDDKIQELKVLEDAIKAKLGEYDDREKRKMQSVVKVYESMKPKDAGKIFQTLAIDIQVDVATRMKERSVALILASMDAQKASILTTRLATYAKPPEYKSVKKN